MEENNKFETNTDSSDGGSMLYSAEPQPQAEESGHSSVYGEQSQPEQSAAPVQLSKPSEPEQPPQVTAPVQLSEPPQQTAPVQQGQCDQPNMMGFGPMQVPPSVQGAPASKPKKKKTGFLVGLLCAAAVLIVIGVGALAVKSLLGGSAEQQLAKGIANMALEMAAYQNSVAEDIGLDALDNLKDTDPIRTVLDFSFTDPNAAGSITSVDIKVDGVTDCNKRRAEYELSAGAYGFSMNVGNMIAADNILYLSIPMVFQNDVYSLELTNLGRDFNSSAWSSLMNETIPEDYSLTLFEDGDVDGGDGEESELERIFRKQGSVNADSVKYETIEQKRAFTFDGTAMEYGGVRVTMDKDAYNQSMEAVKRDILASDFYEELMRGYQTTYTGDFEAFREEMDYVVEQLFGLRLEQDFVLDFYLDRKGRIVNISTPEDIAVSGQDIDIETLAVDVDFAGTERTLDSIEGGIYVQAGDEILYMGISRTADITQDYYSENLTLYMQESNSDDEITFWYANKWGYSDQSFDLQMAFDVPGTSLGISADGGFADIVKGESCTFRIDHGAVTVDGEDLLLMTGSVTVEPTDKTIEVPENAINVLEMSESDIEDLLYDILYQ